MSDLGKAKEILHRVFLVEFTLARIEIDNLGLGRGEMTLADIAAHKTWLKKAKREAGIILINSGLLPFDVRMFWRHMRQEIRARLGNGK